MLLNADPTKQKKYVGWMAKQWIDKQIIDMDLLKSTIKEFDVLVNTEKIKNKDLFQYNSFQDFKKEIDYLNQTGQNVSVKDLEEDFEVLKDDDKFLIISPHTHAASRKLGLTHFAFRECEGGKKDSAWCTTYKAPNHFNNYYYKRNVTFLYIKVKSPDLIQKLKRFGYGPEFTVVALTLLDKKISKKATEKEHQNINGYDALDKQFKGPKLQKYLDILGINFEPQYES